MSKNYTIGFTDSDGTLCVLATINDNHGCMTDAEVTTLANELLDRINSTLIGSGVGKAALYVRQDAPDKVDLED
jgi:hypothetical protein